jgi:hypothetical protein
VRKITAKEIASREGVGIKRARRIAKAANAIVEVLAPLGCCEARRQLRYFQEKIADPCSSLSR